METLKTILHGDEQSERYKILQENKHLTVNEHTYKYLSVENQVDFLIDPASDSDILG